MEDYNLIIAGVIGSAITLLLTAFLDYLKERYRAKIEIQKLLFHRKADVVHRGGATVVFDQMLNFYHMPFLSSTGNARRI